MSLRWTKSKFGCGSKNKTMVTNLYEVVHSQPLLLTQTPKDNNSHLPMFWRSNQEAQVMKQLLLEWFNWFVYEVEEYPSPSI
jgi:hypothetical protein